MKLQPLEDRVIVLRMDAEEMYKGILYIPDTGKIPQQIGRVVAVGPGLVGPDGERGDMQVHVGDTVLFGKYAGTDIRHDNQPLTILRETDILCIVMDGGEQGSY